MSEAGSRAEGTRARLVEAAVAAFAERGFHATTTRDIAAAAGMSPAALYVHHNTKEEVLHHIALTGHREVLASLQAAAKTATEPAGRLDAMMRDFATHHARRHVYARVINDELGALNEEHRAEILTLRDSIDEQFRVVVEEGCAVGEFHVADTRMTVRALTSLGVDVARWYRDRGSWPPERVGDFYADLALRLVGVGPAR